MISRVHGTFEDWTASLHISEDDPASSHIFSTVDATSLSTRQPRRDAHLRSSDFLDVRHYPEMTFVSTHVTFQGSDTVFVTGDMIIKGVTRPVTFDVHVSGTEKDPFGNLRVGFRATAEINRFDFGVTWNTILDSGSALVSEHITIVVDGSAIQERT